jgi:ATP-binding cassette subfamily B protein
MKIKLFFKAIKIIWEIDKNWLIFNLFYTVFAGINPLIFLWISKTLINLVADLLQNPDRTNDININKIFLLLLGQFFLTIFFSILTNLNEFLYKKVEINLDHKLQKMLLTKISTVPYSYFDIPEFYNSIQRMQGSISVRFLTPIRSTIEIAKNIISGISFLIFLLNVHWILLLLSVISALPLFLVQKSFGNNKYWLLLRQTPFFREAMYTSNLFRDRQSIKEIHIFGLSNYFINRWSITFLKNRNELLKLTKKQQIFTVGLDGVNSIFYVGCALIIIKLIKQSTLKIGDYVTIGQAVVLSQSSINACSTYLAKIYEDSLYLVEFFDFMEFKNEFIKPNTSNKLIFPTPLKKGIKFENVSYSYLGSNKQSLTNVSLQIKPGEKIAIIGENGSGKTTLIKCLLGLYPIDSGNIYFDNIKIESLNQQDLYQNISVLFQDFTKYSFTVKENIGFGNISLIDDMNLIKQVAVTCGMDDYIQNMGRGYETHLGKLLVDGEDLSGGQWQKIALARSLIRDSQIIILDEPTASLDPKSEAEIFDYFDSLTQNKTAIFISHRMSATKLADRIIVMRDGKIIEEGTFSYLIGLEQEFYKMYKIQSHSFETERPFTSSIG